MSSTASSSSAPVARRTPVVTPRRTLGLGVLAFTLLLSACGSSDSLGGKVAKDGMGCTISEVKRETSNPPEPKAGTKVDKKTTPTEITKADKDACATDSTKYL